MRARAFYLAALAPLGYHELMVVPAAVTGGVVVVGYGEPPKPDSWLHEGPPQTPRVHIAFRAGSRAQVDAFCAAALGAGGRDNGHHANDDGAFVLDPDGHNIEAVGHDPA